MIASQQALSTPQALTVEVELTPEGVWIAGRWYPFRPFTEEEIIEILNLAGEV